MTRDVRSRLSLTFIDPMHTTRVSRRARAALAAGCALSIAACGDSRVGKLAAGIPRDSALKVMQTSSNGPDSLSNVHERGMYLTDGQLIEVLLYPRGSDPKRTEKLEDKQLTPLVLRDGKVVGWGWKVWDSVATAHKIGRRPMAPMK
jgi:hypothetical protein